MRTWSTLLFEEARPIGRLQRLLSSPNQDGSHTAPSNRRVGSQRECGWKHSAKDTRRSARPRRGADTSALTKGAFSWKFAPTGFSEVHIHHRRQLAPSSLPRLL